MTTFNFKVTNLGQVDNAFNHILESFVIKVKNPASEYKIEGKLHLNNYNARKLDSGEYFLTKSVTVKSLDKSNRAMD